MFYQLIYFDKILIYENLLIKNMIKPKKISLTREPTPADPVKIQEKKLIMFF